jgi:Arm domain-containing DNA-binding protein
MGVQFPEKWGTIRILILKRQKMALTDVAIRGARPSARPFKVYDRDGLFLLVNPNGSKLWQWPYRIDGKEKLMALGEYPLGSLVQAREGHLVVRTKLAAGIDPMAERKAEAEAKEREYQASGARPK